MVHETSQRNSRWASYLESQPSECTDYFEESMWLPNHFVDAAGMAKLKTDHPDIWKALGPKTPHV